VTVTDPDGRRHSLDVLADSTYDAAHLFVVEAKKERAVGLPKPTLATVFEVVVNGKVYRVAGVALQRWIVERRQRWNGPKGFIWNEANSGDNARPSNRAGSSTELDRHTLWRQAGSIPLAGRRLANSDCVDRAIGGVRRF
jgi:hypothetical protein